jgi:hypothetical protein
VSDKEAFEQAVSNHQEGRLADAELDIVIFLAGFQSKPRYTAN